MVLGYKLLEATNMSSIKAAGRNDVEVSELIDYIHAKISGTYHEFQARYTSPFQPKLHQAI